MKNLITICGRGGSKGLPNKNLLEINGKPLIAYSIETAKNFAEFFNADLVLSTDSNEIKNAAEDYGLSTNYSRPDHLASDVAGKADTILDVIRFKESEENIRYEYILDLDITSPLRTLIDLQEAFKTLENDKNALNIFSVNRAERNPYFNMVERDEKGYCKIVKDGGKLLTRQSAPEVFDLNASFYFYKRNFFDKDEYSVINSASLCYLMKHVCFDIDNKMDYQFMKFLMEENQLDFKL
jgi:CMP-N,N'-diacetyllegionaminic acid synthase